MSKQQLHHRVVPAERGATGQLLLLHSLAMDGGFWEPMLPYLTPYADVLLVDLRGHGKSPPIASGWSVADHADDLDALLTQVGWSRAVTAGASMGGCIALGFAGQYPQRVSGLGLIDTTSWYGPEAAKNWEGRAAQARAGGMQALVSFQIERWFSESFRNSGNPVIERALKTFLANDVASYEATCRMLGGFDGRAFLPKIACPTAVMVGERDYATPLAMAQALADGIKGATLTVLPNVQHFTPLEVPQQIAGHLATLIKSAQLVR